MDYPIFFLFLKGDIQTVKPKSKAMNPLTSNDTLHIAGQFEIQEAHLQQASFIAFSKIQLYKLSRVQAAYCKSKADMEKLVSSSLFRFVQPSRLLLISGFAEGELDN